MKIYFTNKFPFGKFRTISLFGRVYYKDNEGIRRTYMYKYPTLYYKLIEHERTHWEQQKEMLFLPFFIWYIIEYLIKCLFYRDAYKNLSFEREAMANGKDTDRYEFCIFVDSDNHIKHFEFKPKNEKGSIKNRKRFAWVKYIFKDR